MRAACTQYTKPAPFITHTHPSLSWNTPPAIWPNKEVTMRERADMSWCFASMINIYILIHWPCVMWELGGLLTRREAERNSSWPWHRQSKHGRQRGNGSKNKEMLIANRSAHGEGKTAGAWARATEKSLSKPTEWERGWGRGVEWEGKNRFIAALVYTSAPNAHRSSGSVACTRRRSCPLFPCNTTKRGGFPGKSLIWSAVKSETKTC